MVKKERLKDQYKYVLLSLYGNQLNPKEITLNLGLEPCYSSFPSEKTQLYKTNKSRKQIGQWCLTSRLRRDASIENHLKDVLSQIKPKIKEMSSLLSIVKGELTIAVQPHPDVINANYYLPANLINEFTKLGINIHLSFYDPCATKLLCK